MMIRVPLPGRKLVGAWLVAGLVAAVSTAGGEEEVRLITLDPGHFHAALFQKEMLPGIAPRAHVYAPLGPDLTAHLSRVAQFNLRDRNPTHWELEVHAGPDSLARVVRERVGNVVVLSGVNRGKVQQIDTLVRAGFHVLADKPWIIEADDLSVLEGALGAAEAKGVAAYDAMTQRFEITCQLARELVQDAAVFGECVPGTETEPAVRMESVHYLVKTVAGAVLQRPPWFFDVRQLGEGLADVGTHLVDLVQWTLFPNQPINYKREIAVQRGAHWPTVLTREQFQAVTGEKAFPAYLQDSVREGRLECFANNSVQYRLRGIHVRLDVEWRLEPPPGVKDSEFALFRGARSRVEVRQGAAESFSPEVYVIPNRDRSDVGPALESRIRALSDRWPGLGLEETTDGWRVKIPGALRVGHEEHFALLVQQFLGYVRQPATLPVWETPNMLAKYYVTTQGVRLARENPVLERPK